jgi:nucleoside 2-deoxyribosyltransferase
MSNHTLYLAGPMTGYEEFNYPAFNEAAGRLRACGFTVLNPAENTRDINDLWQAFMREAIGQLVTADAIALLPGWQWSRGAKIEVDLAKALGIRIRTVERWLVEANAAKMRTL